MKYRVNGKENRLAFGVYPTITLLQARKARDTAKDQLAQGLILRTKKSALSSQRWLSKPTLLQPSHKNGSKADKKLGVKRTLTKPGCG